ncbi:MAG: glyoxalase/bleomycin resistance protein/dioxygenase superfamily protein [Dehalococcoidia bacterium]|nr:glyoxalase/bleomycin resistance protein/dioxygenase superfamily protein [Dehalococcoidia bacterium]
MFKRIDHVEIVPTNMDRTVAFYTDVLGFKVRSRRKMENPPMLEIAYLELKDTVIELITVKDPAPLSTAPYQAGYRMMAIEVEDMDKAVEYLKGKGVTISRPPVLLGKSKRAEIKDPDGITIELRQW